MVKKNHETAALFELCHVLLFSYIKKKNNNLPPTVGYTKPRQAFSPEQEEKITAHPLKSADIYLQLLSTLASFPRHGTSIVRLEMIGLSNLRNEIQDYHSEHQRLRHLAEPLPSIKLT